MKISNETLSILKNYSQINNGIMFIKGNVLSTVSGQRNILAEATISEEIPQDFGIFDLNNFLSVVSLFKDKAELAFDEKHVLIKGMDGRSKISYRFTDPSMIYDEKNREIIEQGKRPSVNADVSFTLSQNEFEWIIRTADVLGSPNIAVESDGNQVNLVSFDASNDSAHTHSLSLPDVNPNGQSYKLIFKREHLKVLPGSYSIEISSKGISKFSDVNKGINYWITLETSSTYS